MTAQTNAARLLDRLGITYALLTYEVDPDDLAASSVARKLGLTPAQVWKTLLCTLAPASEHVFAVVPGDSDLSLKRLAAAASARSASLAPLKDVQPLTGYIRGGVTVLEAKRPFRAWADESIELHDRISISAGQRGLQLFLTPGDYLRATRAALADLAVPGRAALADLALPGRAALVDRNSQGSS